MSDLISRQVAMKGLMAQNVIMDGSEYHNGFNAGVNRAQKVIRNLSPVQQEITHEQAIDYLNKTGWMQVHDRILTENKADAKAEAIPLAWIKGYIVTCDLFDLRVSVPASKVISAMIKTWEQENPGAKKGEADAVNN